MPRAKRRDDAPVFDRVQEELDAMAARLPDLYEGLSPAERKKAEARDYRKAARWQRRIDKAMAMWRAMPILDQKAWAAEYHRNDRRREQNARMPKAAELPLLYAIVTVAERDNAKLAKAWQRASAKRAKAEARRAAEARTERTTSRATASAPAVEAPAATAEPQKPRKRRSGPRYGVVAVRMPDGTMRTPIYDDDE